jgi:single-strand DNA-binding protein
MNVNMVTLAGNLTRDPQLRYTPANAAVVDFAVAVNRKWRDKDGQDHEETTFVDCTAWARAGEVINEHLRKGDGIFVIGRLKYDQWEDKNGGGKRSKLSVVVESFQFVGGGSRQERGEPSGQRRSAPSRPAAQEGPPGSPIEKEQKFQEQDIPF